MLLGKLVMIRLKLKHMNQFNEQYRQFDSIGRRSHYDTVPNRAHSRASSGCSGYKEPPDRTEAIRTIFESVGGRLEHYYIAFSEHTIYLLGEFLTKRA